MRDRDLVRECANGRCESLIAQNDRLEVEGEVPELADRGSVSLQRAADDLARLFEPALADRVQAGIEQERDSRQRLDDAVVQLVREPPSLVLLRRDQLVRQVRALDLADTRFREQACVLELARREVGEHGRANHVVPIKRTASCQPQRRDLLVARLERNDDRVLRRSLPRPLARLEHLRTSFEEPLGLHARLGEHVPGGRDRAHRLHERLEEARLRRQLLFGRLVPAALADNEVRGQQRGRSHRTGEAGSSERVAVDGEPDDGDHRRHAEHEREKPGPRGGVEAPCVAARQPGRDGPESPVLARPRRRVSR